MPIPLLLHDSWETALESMRRSNRIVFCSTAESDIYDKWLGPGAIGVVFHPEYQRGNVVRTNLAPRYDCFLYFPISSPLHPLVERFDPKDVPETCVFGF